MSEKIESGIERTGKCGMIAACLTCICTRPKSGQGTCGMTAGVKFEASRARSGQVQPSRVRGGRRVLHHVEVGVAAGECVVHIEGGSRGDDEGDLLVPRTQDAALEDLLDRSDRSCQKIGAMAALS